MIFELLIANKGLFGDGCPNKMGKFDATELKTPASI